MFNDDQPWMKCLPLWGVLLMGLLTVSPIIILVLWIKGVLP